jgi:hypothetical protein
MLLNTSKHAWAEFDNKKIHYMMNDMSRMFFEVNDDFLYSDFDVFISDSSKEARDVEEIRQLLQPAMQNGATLMDAADILSSENLSEIKGKLEEIEKRKNELMAQQSQMEQQAAQQEMALKANEMRIKEEDSIRKSETQIIVAEIAAESREAGDEDNTPQIDLQREKIKADSDIKSKQVQETIRSNKVAEKQRQQEIAIKKTTANKPNKTK